MDTEALILLVSFIVLLLLDVPIAVCIGGATVLTIYAIGDVPTDMLSPSVCLRGSRAFHF